MSQGFDQWVRERRVKEGLSLRKAAARVGLSHGTIADMEKGVTPSQASIKKVAQGFSRDENERLALEDSLLILAGYRTPRSDGQDVTPAMGRLLDVTRDFEESDLNIMTEFAEWLAGVIKRNGGSRAEALVAGAETGQGRTGNPPS